LGKKGRARGGSSPSLDELPRWLALSVELLGLATALFALVVPLGDTVAAPLLLVAGSVAGLAGGWILVVNSVKWLRGALRRLDSRREYQFRERGPDLRYVEQIVAAGVREIGSAHPGSGKIFQRVSECKEALRVYVRELHDGRIVFCGYLLLYPLKVSAGEAILKGSVRSEAELESEPLDISLATAPYLYIGMILGTDRHARSHVKDKLRHELIRILGAGEKLQVFARPGTDSGLALMQSYGFLPIGDPAGIWRADGRRLRQRLLAEESLSSAILVNGASDRTKSGQTDA
jgi:hypothetical protein